MATESQAPRPTVPEGQPAPEPAARTEPASPAAPAAPGLPAHTVKRTRISGLWVATAFFAIVLLFLLIFILQNSRTVEVTYFGAHGHLPLGVALLLAAVSGVLLVVLPGTARIIQLRITARRHRRADAGHLAGAAQPAETAGPSASAA